MPPARGKASKKKTAASSAANATNVFDVSHIRQFVELMSSHELSEIDLRHGELRIRLRRGRASGEPMIVTTSAPSVSSQVPAAGAASAAALPPTAAPEEAAEEAHVRYVESPMVGTFYEASSPEAAPFVKVGDQVGPDTPVCIVEAMKVFNEIPAGCSGKILAVLVENGESVEFGQRLYKVDASK